MTDRSRLWPPFNDYNVIVGGMPGGIPSMTIYGPENDDPETDEEDYEWGPSVALQLPLGVVRAIRETLRHTPVNEMHGLDGAIIDELNNQLQQQVRHV